MTMHDKAPPPATPPHDGGRPAPAPEAVGDAVGSSAPHGLGAAGPVRADGGRAAVTGFQGPWRRVVFVSLYELIAIVVTSALFMATGQAAGESGAMAVASSVIAVLWNVTFNHLFERWEARQAVRGRGVARRVAHALGFEGGLMFALVPLMAWWFGISLWRAMVLEAGLLVFFLIYTYVFNWCFDQIFGLPASAQ